MQRILVHSSGSLFHTGKHVVLDWIWRREMAACNKSSERHVCIYFFASEYILWESLGSQSSKCCTGGRGGSTHANNVSSLLPHLQNPP